MNQSRPDDAAGDDAPSPIGRSSTWMWTVCGVLLLATMLNYMDRQTLSLTIPDISRELGLSETQYGMIEFVFGIAFACGGIVLGLLADRMSVRWLYPAVLVGWSLAGIATAYAFPIGKMLTGVFGNGPPSGDGVAEATYLGMLVCRGVLGFFEAGQWPCALITTQRLLSAEDRTFGNSLLQSGASLGAIFTPLVIQLLVTPESPGSWRSPFLVIGLLGMFWIVPWFTLIRGSDLQLPTKSPLSLTEKRPWSAGMSADKVRKVAALVVVVICINLTWHFFRAWLPMYLRESRKYDRTLVNLFITAFYIATDVGCIAVGIASRSLVRRWKWDVHSARMATFAVCALLTSLSTVAARLPAGPLLLGLLLVIAFGSLGLFPTYYSLTQEISFHHQGKVTGLLGATTWVVTAFMHRTVGATIDRTGSYAEAIFASGLAPLIGLAALWLLWPRDSRSLSASGGRQSPDDAAPAADDR